MAVSERAVTNLLDRYDELLAVALTDDHFHFLREAARPIDEADRHAEKELQKKVRTVRGVERRTGAATTPRRW